MHQAEIVIAGLLVAVAGLSALARVLAVPYPIVLVVGGAVFGFVPGIPSVRLDPDVVLVVFLPPLLYGAAFFANLGDIRRSLRVVTLNSIGLVLATMALVALVAHALVSGMTWGAAFTLGAIVSPTDPLAGSSIMRRLDVPRRIISAIEGEGLFNDATALVAYKVAVAAVVSGAFSLADAGLKFIAGAAGGIAIGLAVGWVIAELRARTEDNLTSITISLFSGYAAFIPADALGASGVLAAVTTGIYMGIRGPSIVPARTRLQGFFFWEMLDYLLNASLFVLVGLQLRGVINRIDGHSAWTYAGWAAAVVAVVIVTRIAWGFTITVLIRSIDRRESQRARRVGWRASARRDVERHAGCRLAGGRAGDSAAHGQRGAVSGSRSHHLPDVRRHLRHPRRPRAHDAGVDPSPRDHP